MVIVKIKGPLCPHSFKSIESNLVISVYTPTYLFTNRKIIFNLSICGPFSLPKYTHTMLKIQLLVILASIGLAAGSAPKAHSFCHAGYGVCPDGHCGPIGGDCCEVPGTSCPRDYKCVTWDNDRSGCCPSGQQCEFD